MKVNTKIKNRVVALNIAREGLEGVRNIRDTNWLRHSGNRRERWLCRDAYVQNNVAKSSYDFTNPVDNADLYVPITADALIRTCNHTTAGLTAHNSVLESGVYILHYVSGASSESIFTPGEIFEQFILEPKISKADLDTYGSNRWDGVGVPGFYDATDQEEFRLYRESHTRGLIGRYTHNKIADENAPVVENEPSLFYRKIILERVSPFEDPDNIGNPISGISFCNGDPDDTTEGECADGKIKVTSVVEWKDTSGVWDSVILETHLFDFYQRTFYE